MRHPMWYVWGGFILGVAFGILFHAPGFCCFLFGLGGAIVGHMLYEIDREEQKEKEKGKE